jgi:5-bromo-4-chloroindolyl phosphate hydrolysis protein
MIGEMVPIFGMITGTLITMAVVYGVVAIARGPLGQAIARRIHGRSEGDGELRAEVAELREQVDLLRQQLEETHERLDFAERLLTRERAADRLAEGR